MAADIIRMPSCLRKHFFIVEASLGTVTHVPIVDHRENCKVDSSQPNFIVRRNPCGQIVDSG